MADRDATRSGPGAGRILTFGDGLVKLGMLPRILEAQARSPVGVQPGRCSNGQPLDQPSPARTRARERPPSRIDRGLLALAAARMDPSRPGGAPLVHGETGSTSAWRAGTGIPGVARSPRRSPPVPPATPFRDTWNLFLLPWKATKNPSIRTKLQALLRNWRSTRCTGSRTVVHLDPGSCPQPFVGRAGPGLRSTMPTSNGFLGLAEEQGDRSTDSSPPAKRPSWLDRNEQVGTIGGYRRYVQGLSAGYPGMTVLGWMQQAAWDRASRPIHLRDGASRRGLAIADAILARRVPRATASDGSAEQRRRGLRCAGGSRTCWKTSINRGWP